MKFEGRMYGCDVYSDPEVPPNEVYFISGKLKVTSWTTMNEVIRQEMENMIKACKLAAVTIKKEDDDNERE